MRAGIPPTAAKPAGGDRVSFPQTRLAPSPRELAAAEPLTEGVNSFRLAFGEPPSSERKAYRFAGKYPMPRIYDNVYKRPGASGKRLTRGAQYGILL